jgi:hypothetical protein
MDVASTPPKAKFVLKKSINPKTSPAGINPAFSKLQWISILSNDPSFRAIAFTICRESSPTDSSWADKLVFDCVVDRNIYKLHNLDQELPSYKTYGRRVYTLFTAEIPNDEDILDLSQQIADVINNHPDISEQQHLKFYPNDLWYCRDVAFVEILGNHQTDRLVRDILPGNNVAQYFANNPDAIQTFWKPQTASLTIARQYGFNDTMIKPALILP